MTKLFAFALPLAVACVVLAQAAANNVHLPRYPSVSPDGKSVVFTWRGDLYRVDTQGGSAHRLTSNPQDDSFSTWSPDGSRIAFTSERVGGGNLFTMRADGTDVKQVSNTDRYMTVTGWNDRDGLTLNSRMEQDWFPSLRSYSVPIEGGEPRRLFDAFGSWPIVSPDGTKILFNRGGFPWSRRGYQGPDARDVWMYDRDQKNYTQLTKWPGNDGRAKWVDGETIVYASDREEGTVNLYSLKLGEDEAKAVRLTKNKGVDVEEFDVSRDGKTIVYASWDHLYRLNLGGLASDFGELSRVASGSSPEPIDILAEEDLDALTQYRVIDRNVTESALSPDGKTMAVVAFGQVYVRGTDKGSATRRVNKAFGRCGDVVWSPDGSTLYFSSDAGDDNAIYAATVTLSRGDVKKALGVTAAGATNAPPAEAGSPGMPPIGRRRPTVRPSDLASDGTGISACDRPQVDADDSDGVPPDTDRNVRATEDLDQAATQASPAPTILPGDPTTVPTVEPMIPATTQATTTTAPASQPTSMPATTQASAEENPGAAKWADALKFDVQKFITAPHGVAQPSPSPDGKRFAYQRSIGQLVVRDLATGEDQLLEDGWSEELSWRWSPDSHWIAYVTEDRNNNADIYIAPAGGSAKPVNISRHPDNDYAPRWSADGKILAFLSQRNENESDVYAVYLDKSLESLSGVDLDQYFKDASDKAKKRERPKKLTTTRPTTAPSTAPTTSDGVPRMSTLIRADAPATTTGTDERTHPWHPSTTTTAATSTATTREKSPTLDLDDAYLRIRRLTSLPGAEGDLEITPAGDKILFTGSSTGGRGTFILDREAPEPRRIANAVSVMNLTFEGDKAVVVSANSAGTMNLASGAIESVDISDRLAIPIAEFNQQRFLEAARVLGERYYDANLNGLDWPAVTQRYLDLIKPTTTSEEFDHVANKFIGELNGSHLGISAPNAPNPEAVTNGRLGIVSKRADDGYRVTKVYADGPASKGVMKLEVGDVIIAIEAEPFAATDTLEGKLAGRTGKETLVTVKRGGKEIQLLITPTSFEAETVLAYDDWRNAMAKKVADLSDGKLGYIHVRGMDQGSLDIFERDLFAAADGKKGLIIDVRNNGGGWTTDRLLASIMYPRHAYTRPRGDKSDATDTYPQDRLFIQKYDLPIDMLCNEKSFSNAEIISHAFKTLKRGTLVGQQTAGGVISTGGITLLDGTSVRLPGRGWYTPDGVNMEMHGAMPDIVVPQTPEAESKSADEQLTAAVEDLLKRVGK